MRKMSQIKKQLKKYRKADFDIKQYLVHNYVEDEKAIIPIHITSKEELFSSYDERNIIIEPAIISYIESIVYYLPYQYNITLKITGVTFSDDEKEQIVSTLDSMFGLVAHDKKVDLYYNDKKALLLFILGFGILYCSYFFLQTTNLKFVSDVVNIAGTFAVWEFVDTIWFERTNIRIASLNAGQLAVSKIEFMENEEKPS